MQNVPEQVRARLHLHALSAGEFVHVVSYLPGLIEHTCTQVLYVARAAREMSADRAEAKPIKEAERGGGEAITGSNV